MILNKSIEYEDLGTYDAATDEWVKPKGRVNEGMRTARSRASTRPAQNLGCVDEIGTQISQETLGNHANPWFFIDFP